MNISSVEPIPGGKVEGTIRPPGSKSLTNRALICAAFAQGASSLRGSLQSEDTAVMIDSLQKIGISVDQADGGQTLSVSGSNQAAPGPAAVDLFIANSGTSVRFLTAALSAAGGDYRLLGVERMHQRPIGDLIHAIAPVLQGNITADSPGGCPPVRIHSKGWNGGDVTVAGSVSSQYLSGLMMAAPIAFESSNGLRKPDGESMRINVRGELVSRPYVEMTAQVMKSFGAEVELMDAPSPEISLAVQVNHAGYRGQDYSIEPDASAASYFWAAAAITGGRVTVEGLQPSAMQGDVGFCEVLRQMGCQVESGDHGMTLTGGPLTGVDVDMNTISDTVQTLAVVALFAIGPTRVRGVAHNRFKETDRIADLARELRKLGAVVKEHEDGMTIVPPDSLSGLHGAEIETYHDHRMAMSLSLAGLRINDVRILNPACTAKTYPEYFSDLETLIGRAHRWSNTETDGGTTK
ncbi:MAG: 3-phosphoshikimate 1-carboxyvinyltransferase [Rubripirellula sp.]|jgi:3-phosphoshikimate 1-carboxyvinyltransferase|nr:3-phosphoshikimate 1-carboxyvinyltransferase [Rubripirellula sp.]